MTVTLAARAPLTVPSHVPDFFRWEGSGPAPTVRSVLLPSFPDTAEHAALASHYLDAHIQQEAPGYYDWVQTWSLLHFHTETTVTVRTPPPPIPDL